MKSDVRQWMPWVSIIVDALLINVAFLIAYWVRYDLQWLRSVDPANNVAVRADDSIFYAGILHHIA